MWLSEIMLQQTTVKAVEPYYARFLARFPTVTALAAAPLEEVMQAWAGLGYYARARNLHACAQAVVDAARREVSRHARSAARLPGIGAYTAAAIAAIAFDRRASAGRRQHRARDRAALRGRGATAGRQAAHPRARRAR